MESEIAELELQKAQKDEQHNNVVLEISQFSDEVTKKFSRRDKLDAELKVITTQIGWLEIDKFDKNDELEASSSNESRRGKLANET